MITSLRPPPSNILLVRLGASGEPHEPEIKNPSTVSHSVKTDNPLDDQNLKNDNQLIVQEIINEIVKASYKLI